MIKRRLPEFDVNDGLLDGNGGLSHWMMPMVQKGLIVYLYGYAPLGHNELLAHFERLTGAGFRHFIFDFRSCWGLNNSWPGCLIQFLAKIRAGGGYLFITSLSPLVQNVFEGVGFLQPFDIRESVNHALEELKGRLGIPTLEQELSAFRPHKDNTIG
jgi:anti-anti-sigma regulatory factor